MASPEDEHIAILLRGKSNGLPDGQNGLKNRRKDLNEVEAHAN